MSVVPTFYVNLYFLMVIMRSCFLGTWSKTLLSSGLISILVLSTGAMVKFWISAAENINNSILDSDSPRHWRRPVGICTHKNTKLSLLPFAIIFWLAKWHHSGQFLLRFYRYSPQLIQWYELWENKPWLDHYFGMPSEA